MKNYRRYTIPLKWIQTFGVKTPKFWRDVWLEADKQSIKHSNLKKLGRIVYELQHNKR